MTQDKAPYYFRQFYIPPHMLEALQRYIQHGCPVGDFLTAVLSNDLKEACARADNENLCNLPAYIAYLYNEAPSACWGSHERVSNWIAVRISYQQEYQDAD